MRELLYRQRAWIVMSVALLAVVAAVLIPFDKRGANTSGAGIPRVRFGAQIQKPRGSGRLTYTNAWVATSGTLTIAVYAGGESADHRNGLFLIVSRRGASRRVRSVVVRGSGIVTLLRPATPATEQAALTETLHFVTANGGTGTLDLASDSVALSA